MKKSSQESCDFNYVRFNKGCFVMRYIKIEEYINGAHENFVTEIEISPPEGYALIPDEIEIPSTFPFVNIELDENNIVKKLIPVSVFNIDISPLRNQKLEEVSDKHLLLNREAYWINKMHDQNPELCLNKNLPKFEQK